jgi:hypothetical protein
MHRKDLKMNIENITIIYKFVLTHKTAVNKIPLMWNEFARAAFTHDDGNLIPPYVKFCSSFGINQDDK